MSDPLHRLVRQMRDMYWLGVKEEITEMIISLAEWQSTRYKGVELEDERDDNIHGFDNFVDQISQSSRDYASEYGMLAIAVYSSC